MKAVVITAAVAAVVLLAWGASELHYRNCIDAAEARWPVVIETEEIPGWATADGERGGGTEQRDINRRERSRLIDDCSRLPF